jgi:phage terminase large subunit-like protein
MRDETDGSAEELKGVAEYIRKHKAHDRKEIIKMFEEYQNAGWITYTRKENDRGEIIYKWRKSKTIKTDIAEAEAEQEHDTPDEQ